MNLSHKVGAAIASAILQGRDPEGLLAGCDPASTCTKAHETPMQFANGQPGLSHEIEMTFVFARADAVEAARLGDVIAARIAAAIADDAVRLPGCLVLEGDIAALIIHLDRRSGLAFVRIRITALTIAEQ